MKGTYVLSRQNKIFVEHNIIIYLNNDPVLQLICSTSAETVNRKQLIGIFLSQKDKTLSKTDRSYLKSNLTILINKKNLYTKFHFSMCNLCGEKELNLLVDRPTDRQIETYTRTAAKQYALRSSKGGGGGA